MVYSPRIYPDLIPSLYWTARDQGMPMTRLVNLYVSRGLAMEALGENAFSVLPARVGELREDGLMVNLGALRPFSELEELGSWYSDAVEGLERAAATVAADFRASGVRRNPSEMNCLWRHQTAALNLRDAYVKTLPYLTSTKLRAV